MNKRLEKRMDYMQKAQALREETVGNFSACLAHCAARWLGYRS